MKENYQIYLPYQFHWRPHSLDRVLKILNEKIKTMFLSNMSKSRRLTSTFFPTKSVHQSLYKCHTYSAQSSEYTVTQSRRILAQSCFFVHDLVVFCDRISRKSHIHLPSCNLPTNSFSPPLNQPEQFTIRLSRMLPTQ